MGTGYRRAGGRLRFRGTAATETTAGCSGAHVPLAGMVRIGARAPRKKGLGA